ncbi:hypothetical protein LSCM1_08029 [Leishmania martiniquensis]|uniref:Uncharacterized protein n=1 Tax=Leishmania martiniquensis TaxID=1580590 RepID=A0A836L2X1_9TRYP|nr:hypothetical protein LSCM1_08029 [Leishmania martiniquensis]
MHPHPRSTSAYGSGGEDTDTAPFCNFKRRRIICCAAPTVTVEVATLSPQDIRTNDLLRSTVCMDYHILSRIEDDMRRAEMRQENPESAIPCRGYDFEVEAYLAEGDYRAKQSLTSGHFVRRPYSSSSKGLLSRISPQPARSRRGSASNSRRASAAGSAANTPTSNRQGRRTPHMHDCGCQAHSSMYRSLSQHKGSSPARHSRSPYPSNGRLKPIESWCKTSTRQSREQDYGEVGSGAGAAESAPKPYRQLFPKVEDLPRPERHLATDTERERRLRLAEELASRMESVGL